MNRLEQEKSAYLKHAASQKIDWYPWSEEAFERAQKENKPVFLSSGAVWCHWCHVMAKECFENDEIARILNERFVAVKLDRDERPDIDRRYQQALAAMGMSGGWPMSVFLTHEKKAFYGGTYFPSDDRFGKPGFKTILTSLSEFYATRGKEVHENADKLHDFLKKRGPKKQKVDQTDTEDAAKTMLENFDRLHGGFGSAPKFAMSGAIEFLLGRYFFKKEQTLEYAIRKTLVAMAGGGFHDQLGGGFHRYSMDEAWIVPHFEKMADDNAWLLRNYIDAYSIFGDEFFKKIAENIVYFIRKELSHAEGGFYASMDADVTPDDEGGYFTWTDDQLRQTLSPDEYAVFSLYFLHKGRTMHHDDKKFVLSVCMGVNDIAQNSRMDVDKVTSILETARRKLLAERDKRQKPFVDTALYTSLNGIMISACLRASRVLCDDTLKGFALKSLERILEINISDGRLLHAQGVGATLDDYINIIDALVAAYEVSGNQKHLDRAQGLMDSCLNGFWDHENGGFFDTEDEVVGMRLKGIEDTPHPSANGLAVIVLLKLALISGRDAYRQHAGELLDVFAGDAQLMGIHGAYYFCGIDAFQHMLKTTVNAPPDSALAQSVRAIYYPYECIVYGEDAGGLIPCVGNTCYEPLDTADKFKEFVTTLSS